MLGPEVHHVNKMVQLSLHGPRLNALDPRLSEAGVPKKVS